MATVTVNGGLNQQGLIGIPTNFPTGVTNLLQAYLSTLAQSLPGGGGTAGFLNIDGNTGAVSSTPGGFFIEEITNTDGASGSISGGYGSGNYTLGSSVVTLIVQDPGKDTVHGTSSTTKVILAGNSTVDYIVTNTSSAAGAIYASGNDTVTFTFGGGNSNDSVVAGGGSTLELLNNGSVTASVGGGSVTGASRVQISDAQTTITATGNASVQTFWFSTTSAGKLDFINNSSNAATVNTGSFGAAGASLNQVTAFGGAGGGYYVGGLSGNNSLVGGTGTVTLVGGGNGDFLEANGSHVPGSSVAGSNALFAGTGQESLIATSHTGNNLFELGVEYPGTPPHGGLNVIGLASTDGSGNQDFFLGKSGGETIYGSSVAGATNIYNVVGDPTTGSSQFFIYNFTAGSSSSSQSFLELTNISGGAGSDASVTSIIADPLFGSSSTDIVLSDHTQIHLIGVSDTSIVEFPTTSTGGIPIYYTTQT